MKELIFATGNAGKLKEVREIFGESYKIISLKELNNSYDVIEDRLTFEENALKKAREIYELYGKPVIADDSGLEVEQLDGRPGLYSARYAGENCNFEDNNRKIISELKDFDSPHNARFLCTAVYYSGEGAIITTGALNGTIIEEITGVEGFGYDPVFIAEGYNKTLAEISREEKNSISHRGKAFRKLKDLIIKSGL